MSKTKNPKTAVKEDSEKKKQKALENEKKRRQFLSIVIFAVGVLLTLFSFFGSHVPESGENLANRIHSFLAGMFGFTLFFTGPTVIYFAVTIAAEKGGSIALKFIRAICALLLLSAALQILFWGELEGETFFEIIGKTYERGLELRGGGVVGLIFGAPLLLLGRATASVIIILIVFVMVMLIANISLLDFLKALSTPFKKMGKLISKQMKERKEERKIAKEAYAAEYSSTTPRPTKEKKIVVNKEADSIPQQKESADTHSTQNQNSVNDEDENAGFPFELSPLDESESESMSDNEEPFYPEVSPVFDDEIVDGEETEEPKKPSPLFEAIDAFKAENEIIEEVEVETVDDEEEVEILAKKYTLPPTLLLNDIISEKDPLEIEAELQGNADKLIETLKSFGVQTKIVGICRGPSVTRYEIQPAAGVKISKITGLVDDIALNLATAGVRIEAPIPNKAAVGIEVPNKKVDTVPLRSLIDSEEFKREQGKLAAVIGKNISGEIIIADIAKMPHILIAGTTGSGKSVCVNSIVMSILFRSTPDEVRLLMIDPKAVEFMIYNGIPHLLIPVVTDPKKAAGALGWAVTEMLHRYSLFAENNVRDLGGYNSLAKGNPEISVLPQIVIFIDELADLMMSSPGEVEESIGRLAQMARAAGMHLVIATQRPSVNVVTGVIKANIPSRIALKVASQVDSRVIIDSAGGAEKLLGKGDMLYFPVGAPKPMRVQGCWVSDKEVDRVVNFIKNSFILDYDESVIIEIERQAELAQSGKGKAAESGDIDLSDDKLDEAIEAVVEAGQASTSYLQRKLKLGYGRAARIIDIMEELGVVGPYEGSKAREVLMTKQDWYERKLNRL
ncbi:MAG: DNA translocase FtsK [Oscillospiraceae bacterium]|nr:DNA translocase FtsK [Oscillospiraceae bacterium]